jgi:hypothetical protein
MPYETNLQRRRKPTLHGVVLKIFEKDRLEFIDENGGGPGVRLKKRQQKKA